MNPASSDTETGVGNTPTNPGYTRFRPRMYMPRVSIFWWTARWPYVKFILRELTSIVVGIYAIVLMLLVHALSRGPEAYESMLALFEPTWSIVLHVLFLAALVFHTITWFNLAPAAMDFRIGSIKLPDRLVVAGNLVLWLVLSGIIAWLFLHP